jgi:hypothetical protein
MVAKFATGSSLMKTLNYNEHKVQQGVAELLFAANYPLHAHEMSFDQKLNRLRNQALLNENVKANSVHISLNFDPSEVLDNGKLTDIANAYMGGIGWGEQPYLIYRHHDSGHPHLHIVSVKVDADGKRIETQNIGKNQSNTTRKEIEIAFGLVKAEDHDRLELAMPEPIQSQRIKYGKTQTKRAISNVLKSVLDGYKFSSLPELNAILQLYNVNATRGSEDTNTYKHNGLIYRVLDEQGHPVGVPIKASLFYMQPTLKNLQSKFERNAPLKEPYKKRVKNAVDMALMRRSGLTLDELLKEGIAVVIRKNDTGRIYGITYIDHKNKVVFNGSDLGQQYSANAIQERCGIVLPNANKASAENEKLSVDTKNKEHENDRFDEPRQPSLEGAADALLKEEFTGEGTPMDLRRKKKKKRNRLSNNQ